ncbi:MAG: hypothetical protein WCX61_01280 [Candidatus Peribacteraceae bacterium]
MSAVEDAYKRGNSAEISEDVDFLEATLENVGNDLAENELREISTNLTSLAESISSKGREKLDENFHNSVTERLKALGDKMAARIKPTKDTRTDVSTSETLSVTQRNTVPAASKKAAPKKKPSAQKKKQEVGAIDRALNATLPESWTTNQKRWAAGLTLGGIALAGFLLLRGRRSVEKGKEAAKAADQERKSEGKPGMGWFTKFLIVAGVGTAAFVGGTYLWGRYQGKIKEEVDKAVGFAKQEIEDLKKKFTSREEPLWKKYGFNDEEEYKKACTAYQNWDMPAMEKIFGNKIAEREQFRKDMNEKYGEILVEGLPYKKTEAAFQAYEESMESVLSSIRLWITQHEGQLAIGAALAWKSGILTIIGNASLAVGEKLTQLVAFLAKKGAKTAKSHPIISLLALGGVVIVVGKALQKGKKKGLMPASIPVLMQALQKGAPLPYQADVSIPAPDMQKMKEYVSRIGAIGSDIAGWAAEKMGEIAPLVDEGIAEWVDLKKQELVADNHKKQFDVLESYLKRKQSSHLNSPEAAPYTKALHALEKYRDMYLFLNATVASDREGIENITHEDLMTAYTKLQTALGGIGIQLTVSGDGRVKWFNDEAKEEWDLSVDPNNQDPDSICSLSPTLYYGQGSPEFAIRAFVQKLRGIQENNSENNELLASFVGKTPAMVFGNFVYILEEWKGDTISYFVAPIELLTPGGLAGERKDRKEWWASFGSGAAVAAVMTLSVGTVARCKRLAIGGGPLSGGTMKRLTTKVLQLNPITSPGVLAYRARRGWIDTIVYKNVGAYLETESGKMPNPIERHFQGRDVNNRLRAAGIRPEWIRAVEDPNTDNGKLQTIARKIHLDTNVSGTYGSFAHYARRLADIVTLKKFRGHETGRKTDMTKEELTRVLRKRMIEKIEKTRKVKGETIEETHNARAEDIYNAVNRSLGGVPMEIAEEMVEEEADTNVDTETKVDSDTSTEVEAETKPEVDTSTREVTDTSEETSGSKTKRPAEAMPETKTFDATTYYAHMDSDISRVRRQAGREGAEWEIKQWQDLETKLELSLQQPDLVPAARAELQARLDIVGSAKKGAKKRATEAAEKAQTEAAERTAREQENVRQAREQHLEDFDKRFAREESDWRVLQGEQNLTAGKLQRSVDRAKTLAQEIEAEIQQLNREGGDTDVITRTKALLAKVEGLRTRIEQAQKTASSDVETKANTGEGIESDSLLSELKDVQTEYGLKTGSARAGTTKAAIETDQNLPKIDTDTNLDTTTDVNVKVK